jgi:hypothetical protein
VFATMGQDSTQRPQAVQSSAKCRSISLGFNINSESLHPFLLLYCAQLAGPGFL